MSAYPCSGCGQKSRGRLASLYSAWFLADGSRTAWKQRLCAPCVKSRLGELLASAQQESGLVTACPACGSDASTSLDPIYLTLYLPKQEPREFALTTDASCAARLRLSLQDHADRLQNRPSYDVGHRQDDDDWAGVVA